MILETLIAGFNNSPFWTEYWFTILFYAVLILIIYLNRSRFEWQGTGSFKFIGLLKTKVGLKLMNRLGRHKRLFKTLGYIGVVVGFIGMAYIVYQLLLGLYQFFMVPEAPPVVSPVIPGAKIPGLGIKVPLIIGWLALFVVILVHEFSHGVVSRAHGVKVKSSGLLVFGPIGGAFVEPDEDQLSKKSSGAQLSVFAAGPFSNILLALLAIIISGLLLAPLAANFVAHDGLFIKSVQEGMPAAEAGVLPGTYVAINNISVNSSDEFLKAIDDLDIKPGDRVVLTAKNGSVYSFNTTTNPNNPERGYLGVVPGVKIRTLSGLEKVWFFIISTLSELLTWIFLLSLGIGLANLLPLGPVDGGRMILLFFKHLFGDDRGERLWKGVSSVTILVLLFLLFAPLFKALF